VKPDVLFARVAVTDIQVAVDWFERFFARPPDVVAHENEVMWRVTDGAWLYLVLDQDRAGNSAVAMAVPDIAAVTAALEQRGVTTGPIVREVDAGLKALALDPDGNSIEIIQVVAGG
jgi:predicted enzyme related to lactoylglutathione lyase